jgi:hypothetical protein
MYRAAIDRRPARQRTAGFVPVTLGAVGVALVLRLPPLLARRPLAFDDGVYGASAIAMRHGDAPFRDVFSSQGPLFLPLVWLGDLLGGRWLGAPRVLPVAAGIALVVLAAMLARHVADIGGVAAAAAIVATSGVVLVATGSIESDGVVGALGAGAVVAAAATSGPVIVAVGALAGAALAVKSLMAIPPVLAALWLVATRRGWRATALVVAIAAAVVVVTALPWDLDDVWRQSVALHLDGGTQLTPGHNVANIVHDLRRFDRLLLVSAAIAVALTLAALLPRAFGVRDPWKGTGPAHQNQRVVVATAIWLVSALAVLVGNGPLFTHHMGVIVVPAAVLVATVVSRQPLALLLLVLVLPWQLDALRFEWHVGDLTPNEALVLHDLRTLVPADRIVITDWPGLAWWADRRTLGDLVDPSVVRIDAGSLTTADVVEATAAPGVCAVLFWSTRFDLLHVQSQLRGYVEVAHYSDTRRLWLRDDCS